VVALGEEFQVHLRELCKVGDKVTTENKRVWYNLRKDSISQSFRGRVPAAPLVYQNIDELYHRGCYENVSIAIGKLRELFRIRLGAAHAYVEKTAFLKSPGYAPQAPHTDFREEGFIEKSRGNVFLAFVPLTRAGMFLQIWPVDHEDEDEDAPCRGRVLFIPYGKAVLVPGDTIHGGGFLSCPLMENLRLHFYIYLHGQMPPKIQGNDDTLDESMYPQSERLLEEGGGPLRELFEIVEIGDTKKRAREEAVQEEEVKPAPDLELADLELASASASASVQKVAII
jgi:hypothetical protein